MRIFRTMHSPYKGLLLLLFIPFFTGCKATYPIESDQTKNPITQHYFAQNFEKGLVYKANFSFKDKSLSGLMVIKNDSLADTRIQLLTHLGPTLMDVTLSEDKMVVHQNLEKMNKKIILNNLEKDLRQIILDPLDKRHIQKIARYKKDDKYKVKSDFGKYNVRQDEDDNIIELTRLGFLNGRKVITEYSEVSNELPDKIHLYHKNINFRIELNLLKRF